MMARGRRGVTLVELVVALAVTGLVLAAANAALGVVIDALRHARANRALVAGEAARATLAGWLRAAALPDSEASFDGANGWDVDHASDTLRFVVADGGALYPGPRHVVLWLDTDPRSGRAGVLAQVEPWPGGDEPGDTLVVAPAATMLDARYLVADHGEERWVDSVHARARLPYGVELHIGIPAPAGGERPDGDALLVLPVVVPIAASRW